MPPKQPVIVALDGHPLNPGDNPWESISDLGEFTVYPRSTPEEIVPRARDAEVIITNKARLTAEVLQKLPNLRFITVTATGVNIIDRDAARERGIPISNVPEYANRTVAQFVFAQLLTLCHQVSRHDALIRAGAWDNTGDFSFWEPPQVELAGKTFGIIGFGKIGQEVGKIAHCLGMNVVAAPGRRAPAVDYSPFEYVSLPSLLAQSDVVSLHCNLTEANAGLVNESFLESMKPSAFLINTARGGLVDEAALTGALVADVIAGAALDVLSVEPVTPDNPLLAAPRCLLTPHMAWASLESRRRLMATTAANIEAFSAGTPINLVP